MRLNRILLSALLVLLCSGVALADNALGGDPVVKTGGGGGLAPTGSLGSVPAGIITTSFTITSPSGTSPGTSPCILTQGNIMTTSPQCLFENDIALNGVGVTITSLIFDAPGIDPNTVMCGFLTGSPFLGCGVDQLEGGGTEISFFDGSIPFHADFTLDFEGFPQNFNFGGTAITPEPGTLALLLGGIGTLLGRRRSCATKS
ncbi:MAG TPA: PEP-CTERM sorting domain-containing protein [Terriglobia bacterium]|nr:PEP-CTERM sorting domain-containing protein [Terriglobia bacterium]